MLIAYEVRDGILHLALLRDLGVADRAAAMLEIEAQILARRTRQVRLRLPAVRPSPASLSVLARTRRLCEGLGVDLTLTSPAPAESGALDPMP
ncbi:hypothetical protein ABZ618_15630 [Streptomyces roseolus]|uniref:hypothetical protein n=1 Tax=Streptomyces roseolus TaxID=67358 RepID=UPI00340E5490